MTKRQGTLLARVDRAAGTTALTAIPTLLLGFALLLRADPDRYFTILREDGVPEWATFVLIIAAAVFALATAAAIRRQGAPRAAHPAWLFVLFGVAFLVGAAEEINWGQRLLRIESPQFFLDHSDQQEINVHNVFQKWSGFKTKQLVGLAFLLYGCALPFAASLVPELISSRLIVLPPLVLLPGFAIAAAMTLDQPTGREEELGEMFGALCCALFMLFELLRQFGSSISRDHYGARETVLLLVPLTSAALLTAALIVFVD